MKIKNKTKRIISIVMSLLLIASLVLSLTLLYKGPTTQKTTASVSFTDTSNPLVESYKESNTRDLAVLISNRDFSPKDIEKVLQSHGYKSYEDGCKKIASAGALAYIPKFEIDGITYGGYYTTKSTILYHTALEAGIIKE